MMIVFEFNNNHKLKIEIQLKTLNNFQIISLFFENIFCIKTKQTLNL